MACQLCSTGPQEVEPLIAVFKQTKPKRKENRKGREEILVEIMHHCRSLWRTGAFGSVRWLAALRACCLLSVCTAAYHNGLKPAPSGSPVGGSQSVIRPELGAHSLGFRSAAAAGVSTTKAAQRPSAWGESGVRETAYPLTCSERCFSTIVITAWP